MPSIWIRRMAATLVAVVMVVATSLASAVVKVHPGLQSSYDACLAKFNAAGLGGVVADLGNSIHKFTVEPGNVSHSEESNKADARNGNGTGGNLYWNPLDTSPFK